MCFSLEFRVVDNTEWYQHVNVFDFFGKIGRCFRIGDMLHLTAVKSRLSDAKGISFTEFSYQIFQSYDWFQLFKRYQCKFQLGGSDQMGNLNAGYHLIHRLTGAEVYGITLPILTTRGGIKFGKSADNAIWLDAKKTSEFSLYQFFIRVEDDDVERLLKLLTLIPVKEIDEIIAESRKATHLRKAQQRLAEYLTTLIHGSECSAFSHHAKNNQTQLPIVSQNKDLKKLKPLRRRYTMEISLLWPV